MKNKVSKTLKNILYGGLISLGLAGGMKNTSAQDMPERTIYDMFDHPVNHNREWVDINKQEKTAFRDSALKADTSHLYLWDPIKMDYRYPGTLCGNMVGQFEYNFTGAANLDTLNPDDFLYKHYNLSDNGKWQIPVHYASTTADNGVTVGSHAVGAILMGDSATSFSDFAFIDSYQHKITQPGNWDMVDGEPIGIKYYYGVSTENGPPDKTSGIVDIIRFEKINNKYVRTYTDPSVVLTNPKLDNEAPSTSYSFNDIITNNPDTLSLDYDFHDGEYVETVKYGSLFPFYYDFYSGHFLDNGSYKIDDGEEVNFNFSRERENSTRIYPVYNQLGTIPIDKSEGLHKVAVEVTDYSGNTKYDTINYIIDKTSPEINASIDQIEEKDSADVSINVSDKYLKSAKYSFNDSDWKYFSNDTSFKTKLKEGNNILKVVANDEVNVSNLEKILFYKPTVTPQDTIKPVISYTGVKQDSVYNSDVSGRVTATDDNLDDWGYFIGGDEKSQQKISLKDSDGKFDLNLNDGKYFIQFYANDTYGNESLTDEINFSVDKDTSTTPTGLEKRTLDKNSYVYSKGNGEFTYNYVPSGKDVNLDVYNLNGQKVYSNVDTDNDGKMNINLSDKSSGVYIYKASDGSSGKFIKN